MASIFNRASSTRYPVDSYGLRYLTALFVTLVSGARRLILCPLDIVLWLRRYILTSVYWMIFLARHFSLWFWYFRSWFCSNPPCGLSRCLVSGPHGVLGWRCGRLWKCKRTDFPSQEVLKWTLFLIPERAASSLWAHVSRKTPKRFQRIYNSDPSNAVRVSWLAQGLVQTRPEGIVYIYPQCTSEHWEMAAV